MLRNIDLSNPGQMTKEELELISLVFKHHKKRIYTPKNKYKIQKSGEELSIRFSHEILRYRRDPEGKHANGHHKYAVKSQRVLGEGSFAEVIYLPYIFTYDIDKLVIQNEPRAFKQIRKDLVSKKTRGAQQLIEDEVSASPKFLRMKPARRFGKQYGSVMRYLDGEDLVDFLKADRKLPKEIRLNSKNRIDICLAIIKAYKEQIQQNDIVHRDLKPHNIRILYDKQSSQYTATIFDYNLAKKSHEDDSHQVGLGNQLYGSPENFSKTNTTTKSDIWSLACILTEILGSDRSKLLTSVSDLEFERKLGRVHGYEGFCEDYPHHHLTPRRKLNLLIRDMSKKDPDKRAELDEIDRKLLNIRESYDCLEKIDHYETKSHRSQSMPTMFTNSLQPEEAAKLKRLVHGFPNHGFSPERIRCSELSKIIESHSSLVESHLSASNPALPFNRRGSI